MKVYDKDGSRYIIEPKRWWNINDWIWCLDQCDAVRSQSLPKGEMRFNFPNGTIRFDLFN